MDTELELYNALIRYFHTLEHTGYYPYTDVYSIIVLDIIEYILNGNMSYYVSDDDYRELSEALECIYGSCLIPYRDYLQGTADKRDTDIDQLRITETSALRASDNDYSRIKS